MSSSPPKAPAAAGFITNNNGDLVRWADCQMGQGDIDFNQRI